MVNFFHRGDVMDIEHYKEFLLLSKRLNFTEAAAELNMTQPALSKHIRLMEKEMNARLFDRSHHGLCLTEAGKILFENAAAIVERHENAKQSIAALSLKPPLRFDGHFDEIDISSFVSATTLVMREKYDKRASFDSKPAQSFVDRLNEGEIDAFIGYIDPLELEGTGLVSIPFMRDKLVAVMESDHRLSKCESISLDDLKEEVFIRCGGDLTDPPWKQIRQIILSHGYTPKTRHVPCTNEIDFFTTPFMGGILLWKRTYRQLGLLLAAGKHACIPLSDEDACLTVWMVFKQESQQKMQPFLDAAEEARASIGGRKHFEQRL